MHYRYFLISMHTLETVAVKCTTFAIEFSSSDEDLLIFSFARHANTICYFFSIYKSIVHLIILLLIGTNWPLPQLWLGGGHTYFIGWNNTCSKKSSSTNASHFKCNSINYIRYLLKVSYVEYYIINVRMAFFILI